MQMCLHIISDNQSGYCNITVTTSHGVYAMRVYGDMCRAMNNFSLLSVDDDDEARPTTKMPSAIKRYIAFQQ